MNSDREQTIAHDISVLIPVFDLVANSIPTPAFVYEEEFIRRQCEHIRQIADGAGCKLLYSLKALTLPRVLELIEPHVQGFSVSSLYESMIARETLKIGGTVHLTTPGLRPDEVGEISDYCDFLSFNSISQWLRHKDDMSPNLEIGLRVNPEISFLDDSRYDPCRAYSKLGEPIRSVKETLVHDSPLLRGLSGLLFHNNCNSPDFQELLLTVNKLENELGCVLDNSQWINLGGGYLFDDDSVNLDAFNEAVWTLKSKHDLKVFIEPGSTFVRDAGFLVSTVLDLIENGGKSIAILDTSVNHLPESFEYDWRPDVLTDIKHGRYNYIIAGSTCLAGDVFGEYSFAEPLEVGSKVVMHGVGSYNLVKAHTFNGLPLPSIYVLHADGEVTLIKEFTLKEQSQKWGFEASACFGN